MSAITFESKAYKSLMDRLSFLETTIKVLLNHNTKSKWITEEETMIRLDLGKKALQNKRREGVLRFTSEKGRKIKYLRQDVEDYLDKNSNA